MLACGAKGRRFESHRVHHEFKMASSDYAKTDWAKLKTEGYMGGGSYGEGFEKAFEAVGLELSLINSPDEEVK